MVLFPLLLLNCFSSFAINNNIVPLPWEPGIHTIHLCLVHNKNFPVSESLISTAVDNVNNYLSTPATLPYNKIHGLVIEYHHEQHHQACTNYIYLGSSSTSFANTKRKFNANFQYQGGSISVDTKVLQTAASFYNPFLHELLHLVGVDHPVVHDPATVMGYAVTLTQDMNRVYQDWTYRTIHHKDVEALQALLTRDFPRALVPRFQSLNVFPPLNPAGHFSGNPAIPVPREVFIQKLPPWNKEDQNLWVAEEEDHNLWVAEEEDQNFWVNEKKEDEGWENGGGGCGDHQIKTCLSWCFKSKK
jgi:hypothetical protein